MIFCNIVFIPFSHQRTQKRSEIPYFPSISCSFWFLMMRCFQPTPSLVLFEREGNIYLLLKIVRGGKAHSHFGNLSQEIIVKMDLTQHKKNGKSIFFLCLLCNNKENQQKNSIISVLYGYFPYFCKYKRQSDTTQLVVVNYTKCCELPTN